MLNNNSFQIRAKTGLEEHPNHYRPLSKMGTILNPRTTNCMRRVLGEWRIRDKHDSQLTKPPNSIRALSSSLR